MARPTRWRGARRRGARARGGRPAPDAIQLGATRVEAIADVDRGLEYHIAWWIPCVRARIRGHRGDGVLAAAEAVALDLHAGPGLWVRNVDDGPHAVIGFHRFVVAIRDVDRGPHPVAAAVQAG